MYEQTIMVSTSPTVTELNSVAARPSIHMESDLVRLYWKDIAMPHQGKRQA